MEAHEKRTIIKNIKWLTISKIIVYLLSIVTITLIPRYLGVEGYGQLNFIISFVAFFSVIGELGLNRIIVRDISKNPNKADEYFNNLFLFVIISSILFVIIVSIFTILLHTPAISKLIIIYSVGVGFILLTNFNFSFFNAFQEGKYLAISDPIQKIIYTIAVILVIFLNYKLFGIILAGVISSACFFLLSFIFIKKKIEIKKININKNYIKEKLITAYPFILTTISIAIYFSIDKIFITYINGAHATGLYSISYTFISFLSGILVILNTAFFPVISNYSINKPKLKLIIDKYLLFLYLFCIPVTIGGIYLAPKVISLVFGSQFIGGTFAFQLIMFFFLLNSIGLVNYYLLITNNLEKYSLKILMISAVTNIILNFIFIPWLGIIGAAITTIISEIVLFIGSNKMVTNKIFKIDYFKPLIYPLLSGFIMLLGLIIVDFIFPAGFINNKFDVLITIVIGAFIYLLVLVMVAPIDIKKLIKVLKDRDI
jgi:O-antigen/teichoic acid export membrane protein